MRRLSRRTGWLGWAVAGVLLLSAGGAALAAAPEATTTTRAQGGGGGGKAGVLGEGRRGAGLGHGLGRRALHGEVTLQTRDGVRTVVLARGKVTALSGDSITLTSSDDVATTFRIDGDTRFGFRNQPQPSAELKVGDSAWAVGTKSGETTTAKRIVAGELPQRGAGAGAGKDATP
jgi:hypothetical protein